VALWVTALLLDLAHIILLPSGIILGVVCWSLLGAAAMTVVVIEAGTTWLDLWSAAAWKSFEFADAEAVHFHHDFIGTEHVLLGLMSEPDGTVSKLLGKMGVQRETVRAEIEKIVVPCPQPQTNRQPVYTPRAKKSIQIAILEARVDGQNRVQPEHILLGLLREGSGVAAKVLTALGADATTIRTEIQKI
jgi:ATP-dependent Clp protease ATP-binding subunit ClpA